MNQLRNVFDVPLTELTKPVPEALLLDVLAEARFTPSAANLQPWAFVSLTTPERIQLLADHSLNALGLPMPNHRNLAIVNVAHLVLVCIDVLRAKCRFGDRGLDVFAVQDVAAAVHTVRIAAHAKGIASHWIRELEFGKIETELGLAPRLRLQGALAFGLLDTSGLERPPHLEPEHFVFSEGTALRAAAEGAAALVVPTGERSLHDDGRSSGQEAGTS